jgi:hypothetical protein
MARETACIGPILLSGTDWILRSIGILVIIRVEENPPSRIPLQSV